MDGSVGGGAPWMGPLEVRPLGWIPLGLETALQEIATATGDEFLLNVGGEIFVTSKETLCCFDKVDFNIRKPGKLLKVKQGGLVDKTAGFRLQPITNYLLKKGCY